MNNGIREIHSRNGQVSKECVTVVKVKDVVALARVSIVGRHEKKWSCSGFVLEIEIRDAFEGNKKRKKS